MEPAWASAISYVRAVVELRVSTDDNVSASTFDEVIGMRDEVCKKWLSARRGRALSSDESRRFALVLNALRETIKEQSKIDRTIETCGGWPNAFRLVAGATAAASVSPEEDDE